MAYNDLFPIRAEEDKPTSRLEDDDLIARAKGFVKAATSHSKSWRDEAWGDYAMHAGQQWEQDDLLKLQEQGRPPITFNRIAPVIQAVAGSQVNNRQEVRFLPRGMDGDDQLAETATRLVDWMDDACDAEDEISHAFTDAAICGMGWTETVMDYGDDPEGVITTNRVDPLEMYWDANARKRNLSDAKEFARIRRWRLDAVMDEWPEAKDDLEAYYDADERDHWERDAIVSWREPGTDYDEMNRSAHHIGARLVDVLCYVWCEKRPFRLVQNPVSQKRELVPEAEYRKLEGKLRAWAEGNAEDGGGKKPGKQARESAKAMLTEMRSARQMRNVWFRAFICGGIVLERSEAPVPEMPQFTAITGMMDRNSGLFYGMVRSMRDPQRFANKWLSQATHLINTTSLGGWIAEEDAFTDANRFEQDKNTPGATLLVKPGALQSGKIKERTLGAFPAGQDRLLQFAISSIPDVTGINKEVLGLADREQAGVLEAQRKQAAQAILAPLFDSLRRHFKERARLMYLMLVRFVPPDRQVRVTDDGGQPQVVSPQGLPKDGLTFDVVVDEAPTSPNAKMEAWAALQPILPALMKMPLPPPFWMEVLRMSPIPASAVQKIKGTLEQAQQQAAQQPPPDPKTQMELQGKQIDLQIKQREAEVKMRELDLQGAQLQIQANQPVAAAPPPAGAPGMQQGGGGPMGALNGVSITLAPEQQEALIAAQTQQALAVQEALGALQGNVAQILQGQEVLNTAVRVITAPKRVLRGPDGRVAGVEPVLDGAMEQPLEAAVQAAAGPRMLVRGPDGRAAGLN